MNVRQMERVLGHISYVAAAFGVSAALFALVLRYGLLLWFCGDNSLLLLIDYKQCSALFYVGLAFLLVHLLCRVWLKKGRKEILAYPNAAAYYRQCAKVSCIKIVFGIALCITGMVFNLYASTYFEHGDLSIASVIGMMMVAVGTYFAASLLLEWRMYGKLAVSCVEEEKGRDAYDYHAERKRGIIKWSVYWVVVLVIYFTISFLFESLFMYAFYFVFAAIHFFLWLMMNNSLRPFGGVRAKRVTVRVFHAASTLAIVGLCFFMIDRGVNYNNRYIDSLDYTVFEHTSSFAYDRETGVYTVTGTKEEVRILQLTDIHICGSIATIHTDRKALNACYSLIREVQPDLIIITGDLVYPVPYQTFSRNNLEAFGQICIFMNHIGIPWAFVYGNHDTEKMASYNAKELSGLFNYYSSSGESLLYTNQQPDVYGRYNQYIRIENKDHTLNRLLFLIDSNDYIDDMRIEYDSVHTDQIEWYRKTIDQISEQEGRIVPSFVFMHIPFGAFADAQEALEMGSPEAVYLFGKNEEKVSCPKEDTGFFDAILNKKSTEAVFVGHDHLNHMGIKYKGVDLVYSKSIDYYAYPGIAKRNDQRGGTLIVLSPDGGYRIEQVDYIP